MSRPHEQPSRDATLDLRAQPKVYVVFASMVGVPSLPFVAAFVQGKPVGLVLATVFPAAALLAFTWLRGYRLRLTPQRLEYQSLFGGKHSLALSDVERAHTEFDTRRALGPTYRLVITPTTRCGARGFSINVPIFAPAAMRELHERLRVEPLPE